MNEQVNKHLRNILNSWAQGLLTQEETINRIKEEAGYESEKDETANKKAGKGTTHLCNKTGYME